MTSPARDEWARSVSQHRERRAAVKAAREALGQPVAGQLNLDQLLLEVAAIKAQLADLRRPVRDRVKAAARRALGAA